MNSPDKKTHSAPTECRENELLDILAKKAKYIHFTKEVCESAEKYKLSYAEIESLLSGYITVFREAIEKNPEDANKLVKIIMKYQENS